MDPISSIATAWSDTMMVVKGVLPSTETLRDEFLARSPNMYARARMKLQNRLYRRIKRIYSHPTGDIIQTEVEVDCPTMTYTEQSDLCCLLKERFGLISYL